jgi:alkanesulfonate monooxygenase SsuD/methylene tetrahydromethanopterin reductase-like flavin-dependent oxidoreductase (luciferase family)
MTDVKLGANLWSQASDWPAFLSAAQRAEALGFDSFWTWDHLLAIFGDSNQPIFEGYTALAAVAQATDRIPIGLFVGANPFRNPALVAKCVTTIDHISGGRAIMGLGGAWFELEHRAFGIDFGSGFGERLDWLGEALEAVSRLVRGETVTSPPGGRYAFDRLRIDPPPVQSHLPIMIGGSGEQKTLRLVARYADIWNAFGSPETLAHKDSVLRERCEEIGRDPNTIERTVGCKITIRRTAEEAERARRGLLEHNRTPLESVAGDETFWTGTPEQIAETMARYRTIGFHTFIVELPAPYDEETMETLIRDVKPMVAAPTSV